MRVRFWYILLVVLTITVLHISAILFGWYEGTVIWVDNIEHILAGIAFSMIFLLINNNKRKRIIIFMLGFVLITSILWELFEFYLLTFFPLYAKELSLYSPNIIESLEDILSNMIGGIIFALLQLKKNK